MAEIEVLPATVEVFDDVEKALTGGGDGASCQCQWWMLRAKQFDDTTRGSREELLREEAGGPLPPGLVARVDGEAAGWVRVGPRKSHVRLERSRSLTPHMSGSWSDDDVWVVSCFSVPRKFRQQGVNAALLDGAIAFAREHGARVLEAYPRDPSAAKIPVNDLFVGVLSTFLAAGFHETARANPQRAVVTLDLAPASVNE